MIPLFQGLLGQTVPAIGTVDCLGSLEGNIKISALDSQVETGVLIFNEMKCNLFFFFGGGGLVAPDPEICVMRTSGKPFCCK